MPLSSLLDLFRKKRPDSDDGDAEHLFALRQHSFKMFLTAWNKFQETMTEIEYTLCCDHPFGQYRVHALCTSIATQVFQCIQHLERLDQSHCADLYRRFAELQKVVAESVYKPFEAVSGPVVLPLAGRDALAGDALLVDPATLLMETLRDASPKPVPEGFVVTMAGCSLFFSQGDMESEINRRIQTAGGFDVRHLASLARHIGKLVEEAPFPGLLRDAVVRQVHDLRLRFGGNVHAMRLLIRGCIWPRLPEYAENASELGYHGDVPPGLILWLPPVPLGAGDDEILRALHQALAAGYGPEALIYRRARGLTDSETGMAFACMAIEAPVLGGTAYARDLSDLRGGVKIFAAKGLPHELEGAQLAVLEAAFDGNPLKILGPAPDICAADAAALQKAASAAASLKLDMGSPLSLAWFSTPSGAIRAVLASPAAPCAPENPVSASIAAPPLLAGGVTASRGCACGHAVIVKNWEDARHFPVGAVLVVPDDRFRWVAIADRAVAIIAERGTPGSRLASMAREFGKPALFGVANATEKLPAGRKVTVCADKRAIYAGVCGEVLDGAPKAHDFMPGSPVYTLLQHAGSRILPLTLDVESVDFKAANCQTYHDIARYCHEQAVSAMFSLGSGKKYAQRRVKQLRDGVPKQFWVVNLSDGFAETPSGPIIDIDQIVSTPMLALWRGMNAQAWEGPPPVDGKGFLSVLFEATANPNLDPAMQSAYFSEKNYFLISRDYCSLHSRFGFHFVSVEARLGSREKENYLAFQLRGGAANIERRILRVRFVADLLWEFGFMPQVHNDAVTARLEGMNLDDGEHLLAVAGYMTIHTRQLDMIMQDAAQVAAKRDDILAHCRALFTGRDSHAVRDAGDSPCQ